MNINCTMCSKNKREDVNPIPAIQRYLSNRIKEVYRESKKEKKPFRILSGKYGLVKPGEKIKWYDRKLTMKTYARLVPKIKNQLREQGIKKVTFFSRKNAGSKPYIGLIRDACRAAQIPVEIRIITPPRGSRIIRRVEGSPKGMAFPEKGRFSPK